MRMFGTLKRKLVNEAALVLGQSFDGVLRSLQLVALVAIGRRFGYQLLLDLDGLLRGLASFRRAVCAVQRIRQVTKRAGTARAQQAILRIARQILVKNL